MSTLRFDGVTRLHAPGTRNAFDSASDQLVNEGHPAIVVVSGDRDSALQEQIFRQRYVPASQVNGRHVYDYRTWNGVLWARISDQGTVAVPGTSPHEFRRAADLGSPYNNRHSAAHQRLQQIAGGFDVRWTGVNFREDWHWEYRGDLGTFNALLFEEDDMFDDNDRLALRQIRDVLGAQGGLNSPSNASVLAHVRASVTMGNELRHYLFAGGQEVDDRIGATNAMFGLILQQSAQLAGLREALAALALSQGADPILISDAAERGTREALVGNNLISRIDDVVPEPVNNVDRPDHID